MIFKNNTFQCLTTFGDNLQLWLHVMIIEDVRFYVVLSGSMYFYVVSCDSI